MLSLSRLVVVASASLLLSGCFYAAMTFGPLGLQVVEAIGIHVGEGIAGKNDPDNAPDSARCQQLLKQPPFVAQARMTGDRLELRQLAVRRSDDGEQWDALKDDKAAVDGWRSETNLASLAFDPPIQSTLKSEQANYLATAPVEAESVAESNQALAFMMAFGPRTGTYQWHSKRYQYSITDKLPCFPLVKD